MLDQLLESDGALSQDRNKYLAVLWEANPAIHEILLNADELESLRDSLYSYIERVERSIFAADTTQHVMIRATIRECVRTIRDIIGPSVEKETGISALNHLWALARDREQELDQRVSNGFLLEFIYLFRGLAGKQNIYRESEDLLGELPEFPQPAGREAAQRRTVVLDAMTDSMDWYLVRYPSGLDPQVVQRREENRRRILAGLGGSEQDWHSHTWQLRRVIKTPEQLEQLIDLSQEEILTVRKAVQHGIPFGITPYYLSLMDPDPALQDDHAVRAQVIPTRRYVDRLVQYRSTQAAAQDAVALDFMGERDTSPIDLITRRYPRIAILKPYNTCAQICVYCQRNWEIDECMSPRAMANKRKQTAALQWLREHKSVGEVLITGGDPMVLPDAAIARVLDQVSQIEHIYRIRIGTRTPVVLPQRWTDALADLVASYHVPGRREIAVVTHFEHPYEITPEAMEAVGRIRRRGLSVYNQQVFSVENSRRFETTKLRLDLRRIGVDPYYTFNMKGKDETRDFMAPIARLLQERKEEARLLPGLDRTDEPVFNVPRLGKNHLRLWQDHRLLTIRPDGRRVYSFHPWEKNISLVPTYTYVDVSIYDYLQEMAARGENLEHYRTIWYYT